MKTFEECKGLVFGTCGNVSSWLGIEFDELLGLAFEAWNETKDVDLPEAYNFASYFGQRVKWKAYNLHRTRQRELELIEPEQCACAKHRKSWLGPVLGDETTDGQMLVRLMLDCADELKSLRGGYRHGPKKRVLQERAESLLGWAPSRYEAAFAEVQTTLQGLC